MGGLRTDAVRPLAVLRRAAKGDRFRSSGGDARRQGSCLGAEQFYALPGQRVMVRRIKLRAV